MDEEFDVILLGTGLTGKMRALSLSLYTCVGHSLATIHARLAGDGGGGGDRDAG